MFKGYDENKFYVYCEPWYGLELKDIDERYEGVFDTMEEAKKFADYQFEMWGAPDDGMVIFHNGKMHYC